MELGAALSRRSSDAAVVSRSYVFLLPQLEGLERVPAERLWSRLRDIIRADAEAAGQLRTHHREMFPYITMADTSETD